MDNKKLPIHWRSDTHHGELRHFLHADANGVPCDLGYWVSAVESRTGYAPYVGLWPFAKTLDAALAGLAKRYPGFRIVEDAVGELVDKV